MKLSPAAVALAATTTLVVSPVVRAQAPPQICFVVYQMADNDLEYFLRNDNLEIIESCAVEKRNLHTWAYFDGRDRTSAFGWGDITSPLEKVWEKDGSAPLSGDKYDGSQYLTYRHDLRKMVSDTKLPGEQNGDSPQVVYDFLTHAFEDCVAKGATEFMASFSSHGMGFYGFGGDENPYRFRGRLLRHKAERREERELVQSNADLKKAILSALRDVPGAPDVLDVLGFDACLMMSVSAVYEYQDAAKYFLASEATEPGHGWAYKQLCDTDSALDLAVDIHENFLSQRQGAMHQSPKTLALIDTSKYMNFQQRFEAFARDLRAALDANDDPEFFALLQRSRASAVSFDSALDNPGTDEKSALDVGSFLESFSELCGPKDGTDLRSSLDAAKQAYDDMYVRRGNGVGTAPATGMHVMWPLKKSYNANPANFDFFLFNSLSVTKTAPNFFGMIHTFVRATSPSSRSNAGGTCVASAQSPVAPEREGQLLLNPSISSAGGTVTVRSDIVTSTDDVFVEYGIDGTEWLLRPGRRGRERTRELKLSELKPREGAKAPAAIARGTLARHSARRMISAARGNARQRTGRRDVEEGYLFYFGGVVSGTYSGYKFSASGARGFYFLQDSDSFTPVFLYTYPTEDAGVKSAEIPVMYFPQGVDITSKDLSYETTLEEGIKMGGRFGAVVFGLNEAEGAFTTTLTLMTNDAPTSNSTISETPPSAGGRIVPIIYVDGEADGVVYSEILGGVDQTVIEWNEEQEFRIVFMSPEQALLNFGLNGSTAIVNMYAFDYDKLDVDNPTLYEGYDFKGFAFEIDATSVAMWQKPGAWLLSLALSVGAYFML